MPKNRIQWNPGDPASMMQGEKRVPVLVLGLAPAAEGDKRSEERKVTVRYADGMQHDVHPNALLAPGQTRQYRQRKARVEGGGVAAEANRLAREGFRLIQILDLEKRSSHDYDDDGDGPGKLATLLFEREVPTKIEKVEFMAPARQPPPPPSRTHGDDESERHVEDASEDDYALRNEGKSEGADEGSEESDEPEPGHEDADEDDADEENDAKESDAAYDDEPETRDQPIRRGAGGRFQKKKS